MPKKTLQQINKLAARSEWSLTTFFADAEQDAAKGWGKSLIPRKRKQAGPLFERHEPLEPLDHPTPLDVDALAANLEPGGGFSQAFDNFEYREPQVTMLRTVAEAFNQSEHVMIEAGTGTGKSIAYLIPALAWASQTGQRVVVSSNTINLQDQLFLKDLPDLHDILPFDFKVAVMKGRSNYLCPRRLHNLMQRSDLTTIDLSVLARILVWLPNTETGDVSEISLVNSRERAVWYRVCSDSATCSPGRCVDSASQPGFFYLARRQAEAAHVVIINHALLLADIVSENNVLPRYQHLIVDEAHHLEDATTSALSQNLDHAGFVARLRELAPTSGEAKAVGLLADTATAVRNSKCPKEKAAAVVDLTRSIADDVPLLDVRMYEFFDSIDRFLMQHFGHRYDSSHYDLRLRLTDNERVQPAWVNVEITWDNASLLLKRLLGNLTTLIGKLSDLGNYPINNLEDLDADLQSVLRALTEANTVGDMAVFKADPNMIYWVRRSQRTGLLFLNSAPLHVGSLIERYIFLTKDTVILTSATLRTAKSFDYMRDRLGAVDAKELALESPFDFHSTAMIYLPTDMPEPNQDAYQGKVEEAILQLSLAAEGRMMVLFTSYAQLTKTADILRSHLEEAGFTLFVQGQGGSRQQLLAAFRQTKRSVMFGTRSFWEGVDVQGDALSALIITRLPFAVPTDPIVSARSESFDSPFFQYSVPEAILHLRQGFGRLIRSTSDRGVCVLLDRRLTSKQYGRTFLESLPDATIQRGSLAGMSAAARAWLGDESAAAPQPEMELNDHPSEEPPAVWFDSDGQPF